MMRRLDNRQVAPLLTVGLSLQPADEGTPMRYLRLASGLLLALVCCTGCGNQQRAEMMVTLNTMVDQPAVPRSLLRTDLAKTIADLQLTRDQADQLQRWAANGGRAVRRELQARSTELLALEPKLRAVGDELVRTGVTGKAAQDAVAARVLGEQQTLVTTNGPPFDVRTAVANQIVTLAPAAKRLSLRQRQVVLGGWEKLREPVAALLVMTDQDEITGARQQLVQVLLEAQGYGYSADERAMAQAKQAVDRVPVGQATASNLDARILALFEAVPASDPAAQTAEVTATLGTFLALEPATELLALVP